MSLHASVGEQHALPLRMVGSLRSESTGNHTSSDVSTILLVDAAVARRRSFARMLAGLGHSFAESASIEQAVRILHSQKIDLIIVAIMAPEMDGAALCRAIRASADNPLLPIIAVGWRGHTGDEVAAMEAGADVVLRHGCDPRSLCAAVRSSLRRKAAFDALDETATVLFTLAQSIEQRDPALGRHCERLAWMAAVLGSAVGLDAQQVLTLQRGGYLHDIGKVAIPDNVLFKPGPLTDEEWIVMKSHTERGERICRNVRSLVPVLPIIRSHHERWDGSGYPDGLKGDKIPLLARIMQFTDIYDALTTARPYKRAFTPDEAVTIMRQETDRGWRDPKLMKTFMELLPLFKGEAEMDVPQFSLQALASAVEQYRKEPARAELQPIRMASGL